LFLFIPPPPPPPPRMMVEKKHNLYYQWTVDADFNKGVWDIGERPESLSHIKLLWFPHNS